MTDGLFRILAREMAAGRFDGLMEQAPYEAEYEPRPPTNTSRARRAKNKALGLGPIEGPAFSKEDLIKNMAGRTGFSQDDSRKALDAAVEHISKALVQGHSVTLPYLGRFELQRRAGQKYDIGEHGVQHHGRRHIPFFAPSPWLRDQVHQRHDNMRYRGGNLPYRKGPSWDEPED